MNIQSRNEHKINLYVRKWTTILDKHKKHVILNLIRQLVFRWDEHQFHTVPLRSFLQWRRAQTGCWWCSLPSVGMTLTLCPPVHLRWPFRLVPHTLAPCGNDKSEQRCAADAYGRCRGTAQTQKFQWELSAPPAAQSQLLHSCLSLLYGRNTTFSIIQTILYL